MAMSQPTEAIPHFQQSLRLNPRFRPFTKYKYMGLAHVQSAQDADAIEALNRALAGAPNDPFAQFVLPLRWHWTAGWRRPKTRLANSLLWFPAINQQFQCSAKGMDGWVRDLSVFWKASVSQDYLRGSSGRPVLPPRRHSARRQRAYEPAPQTSADRALRNSSGEHARTPGIVKGRQPDLRRTAWPSTITV